MSDSDQKPIITLRKQGIEELAPAALFAVERLSAHFEQEAMAAHDSYGRIYFMWTFEQEGDPVQVHMLQTVQGSWALGNADFRTGRAVWRGSGAKRTRICSRLRRRLF